MTPRIPSSTPGPPEQEVRSIVGPYGPFGGEPEMVPSMRPITSPPPLRPPADTTVSSGAEADAGDIGEQVGQYLERLGAAAREIIEAFDQAIENLNVFGPIPEDVRARIEQVLAEVWEMLQRVFDTVSELFKRHAPFLAVMLRTFEWVRHVQAPMTTMARELPDQQNDNFVYWDGTAKGKYETKLAQQQEAIGAVGDAAAFISVWLMDIAKRNVEWLNRLLKLEVALSARIVEAALSARGDPEAFVTALKDVIKTLITDAANELIDAITRIMTSVEDAKKVQGHLAAMGMDNGWPQAVYG
jgi:hypothetical protein